MITVSSWGEEQIGHAKSEDDLQGRFYARKTNQIQNMESTELQTVYRIKVFLSNGGFYDLKKKKKAINWEMGSPGIGPYSTAY